MGVGLVNLKNRNSNPAYEDPRSHSSSDRADPLAICRTVSQVEMFINEVIQHRCLIYYTYQRVGSDK